MYGGPKDLEIWLKWNMRMLGKKVRESLWQACCLRFLGMSSLSVITEFSFANMFLHSLTTRDQSKHISAGDHEILVKNGKDQMLVAVHKHLIDQWVKYILRTIKTPSLTQPYYKEMFIELSIANNLKRSYYTTCLLHQLLYFVDSNGPPYPTSNLTLSTIYLNSMQISWIKLRDVDIKTRTQIPYLYNRHIAR